LSQVEFYADIITEQYFREELRRFENRGSDSFSLATVLLFREILFREILLQIKF